MGTSVGHFISLSLSFLIWRPGIYWLGVFFTGVGKNLTNTGIDEEEFFLFLNLPHRKSRVGGPGSLQWVPTGAQTFFLFPFLACRLCPRAGSYGLRMAAPPPSSGLGGSLCSGGGPALRPLAYVLWARVMLNDHL